MASKKTAPKKKKLPPKDTRTQSERFEQFARDHGADDPDALNKAFGDIADDAAAKKKKKR